MLLWMVRHAQGPLFAPPTLRQRTPATSCHIRMALRLMMGLLFYIGCTLRLSFTFLRGGFGECSLPLLAVVTVSSHSRVCLLSLFSWCMSRPMLDGLSRRLFLPGSLSIIRPSSVFTLIKRSICVPHARILVDAFAQTLQVGVTADGEGRGSEQYYERGGMKTLPKRQYVEGGPRKLALEKISSMDDEGRFRPAFWGWLWQSHSPSLRTKSPLKADCAGFSSFVSKGQFGIREPLQLRSGHLCTHL